MVFSHSEPGSSSTPASSIKDLKTFYPFPQERFDLEEFAVVFHRFHSWCLKCGSSQLSEQNNTSFWEHTLKNTMKLHFISNFETENCFKTWYQVNKHTFCFIKTGNITALTREQKKNTI